MDKQRMKTYLFILFLCGLAEHCFALPIKDSLKNKPYTFYQNRLDNDNLSAIDAQRYISAWLDRAKADRNYTQQSAAYNTMVAFAIAEQRLAYADSAIAAAHRTKSGQLIGNAYLTRGIWHYKKRDYTAALDDYVAAGRYIEKTAGSYEKHKIKFGIAQIKYALGFYDEAVALFTDCVNYFKDNDEVPYLRALHGLGLSYIAVRDFGKAAKANREGLELAKKTGDSQLVDYFIQSDGINSYFGNRHRESLQKLKAALPAFQKKNDFVTESVTQYYIGRNYWALGKKDSAVVHFKQVDGIFRKENFMRPDLRDAYELMIAYYESIGDDTNSKLYYRQQHTADRMMEATYSYLFKKLVREYEPIAPNQLHEDRQQRTKIVATAIVILLLGTIGGILWKVRQRNKRHLEEIEALEAAHSEGKNRNPQALETSYNKIPAEVVAGIRQRLEKFISDKGYLNKRISRPHFARLLKSNPSYVGTVILYEKHKTCNDFINGLRIDYIVKKLQTEPVYREYSINALAGEAGFESAKGFTESFRKQLHTTPSDFIKQLRLQKTSK